MASNFQVAFFVVIPYLVGLAISDRVFSGSNDIGIERFTDTSGRWIDPFQAVTFAIHRNGEPEPCSETIPSVSLAQAILDMTNENDMISKLSSLTKYELDHYLTATLAKFLLPGQNSMGIPSSQTCGPEHPPESVKGYKRRTWGRGENYVIDGVDSPFLTFCDMGEDHTPVLPDHNELIPVESTSGVTTLPCHFHTREGMRITSYQQLVDFVQTKRDSLRNDECIVSNDGPTSNSCTALNQGPSNLSIHIYAVPAGRIFMFAPSYVGEIFEIEHVPSKIDRPISLKVMSLSPKVFDVINFFDKDESKDIVSRAIAETSESHKMKRSSTGASGYNVNNQRTSENGFDTHGKTAMIVKRRCLKVLGFDEYNDSFTDGLQVLRYNKTTAYIPHMDWIDDPRKNEIHNYDSAGVGTNRHSTILLYMSDLGPSHGGETVFKHGWPIDVPEEERKSRDEALTELRASGDVDFLTKGSWEETMVADCRSRLSVVPHSARAVLFYSQHPNGEEDHDSIHGGCPVLHGEKWAANLWVWNGPRGGFPGAPNNPGKERISSNDHGKVEVIFKNTGEDPQFKEAKLYFQDTYWGEFSHGDPPLSVNTFDGHEWNVRRISDHKLLKRIVIKGNKRKQKITV